MPDDLSWISLYVHIDNSHSRFEQRGVGTMGDKWLADINERERERERVLLAWTKKHFKKRHCFDWTFSAGWLPACPANHMPDNHESWICWLFDAHLATSVRERINLDAAHHALLFPILLTRSQPYNRTLNVNRISGREKTSRKETKELSFLVHYESDWISQCWLKWTFRCLESINLELKWKKLENICTKMQFYYSFCWQILFIDPVSIRIKCQNWQNIFTTIRYRSQCIKIK